MKKSFLLSALILTASTIAMAAPTESSEMSTSYAKPVKTYTGDNGFSVAAEYINITDLAANIETERPDGTKRTDNDKATLHFGFGGLRLGYNRTPERGLGFNAGLTYLKGLNKSELGDDSKVEFWIAQGNMTGAFNRLFTGYVGGNISKIEAEGSNDLKPSVGMQFGLGVRPIQGLGVNAGYMFLSQYVDANDHGYKRTGFETFGGFNTNVTYTF